MLSRFAFLIPTVIVVITTLAIGLSLEHDAAKLIFSEGRLVENATVVVYALAIIVALAVKHPHLAMRCHTALILAIMAARELDMHKSFTTESMIKISYYSKPLDPVYIRVISACVVLTLLAFLLVYLKHLKGFFMDLWRGRAYAVTMAAVLVILPVSKTFDSSPRMAKKFLAIDFPEELRLWLFLSEESLEFLMPVLILLAVVQFSRTAIDSQPAIQAQA